MLDGVNGNTRLGWRDLGSIPDLTIQYYRNTNMAHTSVKVNKPKPEDDVVFFDNNTMEPVCKLSTCYDKFEPTSTVESSYNPVVGDFEFDVHAHKCTECGRLHKTVQDKRKTKVSRAQNSGV